MNIFKDYYFWFSQPSSFLNTPDWVAGYIFAGLIVLSVIFWLLNKFVVRHIVLKKYWSRITNAMFWTGLIGMLWFGFRYESVPVFSKRIIGGFILLVGIIWMGWIKYKFIRNFWSEKKQYEYDMVKSKYMPKAR